MTDRHNKYFEQAFVLRKIRGSLTQKAFADKLDIPLRTYVRYEKGEREMPNGLIRLAFYITQDNSPEVMLEDESLSLTDEGESIKKYLSDFRMKLETVYGERDPRNPKNKKTGDDLFNIDKTDMPVTYDGNKVPGEDPHGDLLQMTREILSSKTDYAESLAANIRSFHKSVQLENQINGQSSKSDSRIKSLEEKCEQFLEELTELKKSVKNKNSQCRQAPEESQNTEKKAM